VLVELINSPLVEKIVVKEPELGVLLPMGGGDAMYVAMSRTVIAVVLPVGSHAGTKVCPLVVGLDRNAVTLAPLW